MSFFEMGVDVQHRCDLPRESRRGRYCACSLRGLSLEEACVRGMPVVWALEVGRGGAGSAKHLPSHWLQGLYGRLQRSVLAHQVKGPR